MEEIKLFAEDMLICVESPNESTKNPQEKVTPDLHSTRKKNSKHTCKRKRERKRERVLQISSQSAKKKKFLLEEFFGILSFCIKIYIW